MKIHRINNAVTCKISRGTYNNLRKALFPKSDSFVRSSAGKIKEMENIRAGIYGTCCDGSMPLKRFFNKFGRNKRNELIDNGFSTNINAVANSLLKSHWENPISTSGVMDCSVMYLANSDSETHFLYHMYKDINSEKTTKLINDFMPEGFTHAVIIPGDKRYVEAHKEYLPQVFNAIKTSNPNAEVNVCHFSTPCPEVVGYMGQVYEIPRRNLSKPCQNTFEIDDVQYYDLLYLIDVYNRESSLKELSNLISERILDPALDNTVQERIENKIKSLKPKSKFSDFLTSTKNFIKEFKETYLYKAIFEAD